jgi:uncharacterized protein YdaU (DUF1376 family)
MTISRPWMPFYVHDYRNDTEHLTRAQHGSYMLLIMEYWVKGGLPPDDDALRVIAKCSKSEWKRDKKLLLEFFDAEMHHKRIDKELNKTSQRVASNTWKARLAANARWAKQTVEHVTSNTPGNASSNTPSTNTSAPSNAPGYAHFTLHKKEREKEKEKNAPSIDNGGSLARADGAREPPVAVPRPVNVSPSQELVRRELDKRIGRPASDAEFADYLASQQAKG